MKASVPMFLVATRAVAGSLILGGEPADGARDTAHNEQAAAGASRHLRPALADAKSLPRNRTEWMAGVPGHVRRRQRRPPVIRNLFQGKDVRYAA